MQGDTTSIRFTRVPHLRTIMLSVGASLVTLVLKFLAYRLTLSVGLLSDAVESTVNVVAAFTALGALWYAAAPADRGHPYGHEKIEFFSSGVEGGLIVVAAATIAWHALGRLSHPSPLVNTTTGLVLAGIATAINFAVGRALISVGRSAESIVLEADGRHLLTDVWTSIAVIAGVLLVNWTSRPWLDPLLALLVAIHIVYIGLGLLRRSFDGLMDRALDGAEIARIRAAIENSLQPGMAYHALRTRRAGSQRFADFHLLVPGQCTVTEAHDSEMAIAAAIHAAVTGIEVTTHIEPIEEPLAYNDSRAPDEP